jgi:hypothetical protein
LKRFTENFPGGLRNFGPFGRSGRYKFFQKIHCCPIFLWQSGKILTLQKEFWAFWEKKIILPDNFGQVRKVEANFHFCPQNFCHTEKN